MWLTGPAAPRHVGSSQTRARTRVPCIGRQTLNHCATREAQHIFTLTNLYFFIYLWLRWVFVAACGLSLVVASGGYSSLRYTCFFCFGARALGMGASVVVAHGLSSCGSWALEHSSVAVTHELSCSAACGIFPDQVSNPCPLHWQADTREVPTLTNLLRMVQVTDYRDYPHGLILPQF